MSQIILKDDHLSGTYNVSPEVCRSIFVLLSALESDQKFPTLKKQVFSELDHTIPKRSDDLENTTTEEE